MALNFNGTTDIATRTSVTLGNVQTVMGWIKFDALGSTGTYHGQYFHSGTNAGQSNGTKIETWWGSGAEGTTTLSTGVWYHVAYVFNGTSHTIYLDGVSEISGTGANRGATYTFTLGAWDGSSDFLDGAQAYVRIWNGTALTQAQVQAERTSATAVVTTNLYADWALTSNLNDGSGNARTLTFSGTPSYVSDPSLSGAQTLTGTGKASTVAFGAGVITGGSKVLTGTGVASTTAFGAGSVARAGLEFIGKTSWSTTAGSAASFAMPAGAAIGDLLVCYIESEQASTTPRTFTFGQDNAGWTRIVNNWVSTGALQQDVWWNTIDGTDITASTTVTATASASDEYAGVLLVFRGQKASSPISGTVTNENLTASNATGTAIASCLATDYVLFGVGSAYGTTWTYPTNWTEIEDSRSGTGASNISIAVAYRTGVTSTSAETYTPGTTDLWGSWNLVIGARILTKYIVGTGISNTSSFGAGTVGTSGPRTLTGTGMASAIAFGTGTIGRGVVTVTGVGLASTIAYGAAVLHVGKTLTGTGLSSTLAFGAGSLIVPIGILGVGRASSAAYGNGTLHATITVTGAGFASTRAFGAGSVANPAPSTTTEDWNTQVGDGFSDVTPKQIVRTKAGIVYIVVPTCDSYPDLSANGLTQTLRVYKAATAGIAASFSRMNSANEPAAVLNSAVAIDGSDNLHIVWVARSSLSNLRYLRYAVFNTSTDTWGSVTTIASNLDFDDMGQGDEAVAMALDASGNCHVVYVSNEGTTFTRPRIHYRNNVGGSWSSVTRLDSSGITYATNEKAIHPNIAFDNDGRALVVWTKGLFNNSVDGTQWSIVRSAAGSWGSVVKISGSSENLITGIDGTASAVITKDGRYHVTYVLGSASDNSVKYIRYAYSDDHGATWTANNPTNQATHNPSITWSGKKIRIFGHGTPDTNNHGNNIYYFEGDGGSAAWGSWTQIVTSTHYDCSINTRWAQFFHYYPNTQDIIYWDDAYPNVLYYGAQISALDFDVTGLTNTSSFGAGTLGQTSGGQTVTGTGFANTRAYGAGVISKLNTITGTGRASGNAFGTGAIGGRKTVTGAGIVNTSVFGAGTISSAITVIGAGFANVRAYGAGVIGGLRTVTGTSGLANTQSYGAGVISRIIAITGTGFANTRAYGAGVLSKTIALVGTGRASGNLFGAGALSKVLSIIGQGRASANAFGAGTIGRGAVAIIGVGKASGNTFGAGTIINGGTAISGTGKASGILFGAGTISAGVTSISVTGKASSLAFGAGAISRGITVAGTGKSSTNAFGAGSITRNVTLSGTGFSATIYGGGVIYVGVATVIGVGLATTVALGTGVISSTINVLGVGPISNNLFGAGTTSSRVTVEVSGAPNSNGFGAAVVGARITLTGVGKASSTQFGSGAMGVPSGKIVGAGLASGLRYGFGYITGDGIEFFVLSPRNAVGVTPTFPDSPDAAGLDWQTDITARKLEGVGIDPRASVSFPSAAFTDAVVTINSIKSPVGIIGQVLPNGVIIATVDQIEW